MPDENHVCDDHCAHTIDIGPSRTGPATGAGRCICPRFTDTGGFRIADLACPIHGLAGTEPGDGMWETPEVRQVTIEANDEPTDPGLALWQAYCSEKERADDAEAEVARLRAENTALRGS